jgi:hypothetical protein
MSNKPYIKQGRMGIKSYSIVGWTYNADTYCNSCAEEMGITNDKNHDEMGENDGYPIFADSEWDTKPACGKCHGEIPYVTVLQYDNE